ncbi:hypothetical protein EYF80_034510 [Liparis tanakae]|uniref:Uncharacterized protein n=1 Tax=Liparis tanakae TaxID=230148 RepID=A0A4Z2GRF7_9TELE|nr:hypothetical protein EYF80_034510 [Liparis tanakae]
MVPSVQLERIVYATFEENAFAIPLLVSMPLTCTEPGSVRGQSCVDREAAASRLNWKSPPTSRCREILALKPYMALPARELTADLTADRCELPAARISSRSEPFSRGMSFCLYASRSGANKKSPVSEDWHYMTLRNHCQKAS